MSIWKNKNYKIIEGKLESKRMVEVLTNTPNYLDDLDRQFCELTKLDKTDTFFLFMAIALQIVRQYLLTGFKERCDRLDDKEAAKQAKEKDKFFVFSEKKEEQILMRTHRWYEPSLKEIISRPVPFDANIGANGALSGGGFMGHRVSAIGHDPILGLVFGTANIATSTITNSNLQSFHIKTNVHGQDCFAGKAKTDLVLSKTANKLFHQGITGKEIVAVSLIKEIEHLKSDVHSKNSLPLPLVSVWDSKKAAQLAQYGMDMENVGTISKQASFTMMINWFIAVIHRLLYDESSGMSEKMYKVKTKKIISYSNLVASSSNLGVTALSKDINKLDLGGLGVTIRELITNTKYIKEVKNEFVFGRYRELVEENKI